MAQQAKESGLALLRNIGNKLRRNEDRGDAGGKDGNPRTLGGVNTINIPGADGGGMSAFSGGPGNLNVGGGGGAMMGGAFPSPFSTKLLGALLEETPDLYYEDRPLGKSIQSLEAVRIALHDLASAANEHKDMLIACASTERGLGAHLADMLEPPRARGARDGYEDEDGDPDLSRENRAPTGGSGGSSNHFAKYLTVDTIEAQKVLGRGLEAHAESTIKLATALSNPINDLERSFEERFARKIVPLRKRYIDQKGQYLKYKRLAEVSENDEKRSYFEALAEAAKPVWLRTSTELRTESDVMTELTARNMAKWSRSLALQHERALAIAAANFADAFTRAKATGQARPNAR